MIKKYGALLVLALFLNGCYTQFAVIRDQVPVQRVSYQIDSTGDTVKVITEVDTVTKIKNCYWVRNYWGQPEYRCDGDNGYYSANDYYNSSWYNYNDQPWWYRSYSYSDGAFYSSSYYGHNNYNGGSWSGGGGGSGGSSTSTQSNGAPRASRSYGIPTQSQISSPSSSSYSTGSSTSAAFQSSGSSGSSGSVYSGSAPSSGSSGASSGSGRRSSSFGIPTQSQIQSTPNQEKKR
jgi:hypothetical protein